MKIGPVILADLEERARKVERMLKKGEIPHENEESSETMLSFWSSIS